MWEKIAEGFKVRHRRHKLISDIREAIGRIVLGFAFGTKYDPLIHESSEDFKIAREAFFDWFRVDGISFLERLDNAIINRIIFEEVSYAYDRLSEELDFRYPRDLLIRLEELDDALKKYVDMKGVR